MVPAALRGLAGRDEDVVVACPGLVYRRDVVDRLHVGEPHQLDLWRVRSGPRLGRRDLEQMIELVVSAVLPGSRHRTIAAEHPYTDDGLETTLMLEAVRAPAAVPPPSATSTHMVLPWPLSNGRKISCQACAGRTGSEACAIAVMPAPRPAVSPPANSKPAIRRILIRSLRGCPCAVHPLSAIALQPR